MDTSDARPRVSAAMLPGLVGKKVLLVGKVENVANNVATVTACDGSTVAVTLATGTQGAALDAPVVEFDCVVSGPGAVEEAGTRSPLSANFDMSTYHELVKKAAGAYREMFVV